jgi:syringomycin synthetase protein SyrE
MGSRQTPSLIPEVFPLAISQREVWLDQRAWPGSAHLNIGGGLFLSGPLDEAKVRSALRLLVSETETLRLVPLADGTQRLLPAFEPALELVELDEIDHMSAESDVCEVMREWCRHRMSEPFSLGEQPPWRFALLRSSAGLQCLSIQFHHLIMDGWGTTLVIRRWCDLYTALLRNQPAPAAAGAGASYRDYVEESHQYRRSAAFARDAAYWRQALDALPAAMSDPRAVQRDARLLPPAHVVAQSLERTGYAQLCSQAAQRGYTAFGCFLAALALYLWRTSGREDLVIGVPCLNRAGQRYKRTPGMFVGLVALRLRLTPAGMTAAQLLEQARQQIQGMLRHSRYPLSELGHHLQPLRMGRDSVMDVLLSFERQDYRASFGAAEFLDSRQFFSGTARYPLAVTVCEFDADADLELVLEASAACYTHDEAELLGRRLWCIAKQLAAEPEQPLAQIAIMPQEERWAVLEGQHQDSAQLTEPPTFIDLFEHHAALQPEACALVWDGGTLNYGELNRRAAALAPALRAAGAAPERIVALAVPRSPAMVVALLAVAKSGAAFLPLDVDAPDARLREMLQDSGAVALLVSPDTPPALAALHANVLKVSVSTSATRDAPAGQWSRAGADHLAYVLYTSGSSGKPKGVLMPHGSLSRRLAWMAKNWEIDSRDRAVQTTQLHFDPALIELLLPLTHGASVALPPPGRLHPERLADALLAHGATFCALVPSTLAGILNGLRGRESLLKLRVACCGGEVLPSELAHRFVVETGAQLYNVYGPTEAAIFATAWHCVSHAGDGAPHGTLPSTLPLPLGRPIDDTRIYVLDDTFQPLPFGVTGEVYIGGGALARGYLARPALTEKHFLPDPFRPGGSMYRTFDRGWLDCQGHLHFAGRTDRQIKLRGLRIEPGDVEAACLVVPGVKQAVVQKVEYEGAARLHAWLGVGTHSGLTAVEVLATLRTRLPDYMLPAGFSLVPALPVNSSGKVDLQALPVPSLPVASTARRAPSRALEPELMALWERELRSRPIGVHDNFFDLGGDSLTALGILGAMEDRLGRHLPLQLISEYPTIELLAGALAVPQARPGVSLRLSEKSDAVPLYLAASGYGDVLRFQALAQALAGALDVHMLQPPHDKAPASTTDLAEIYADSIAAQGLAPGWLAGFSVGGVAALETACVLQARGMAPLGLILLDTIHPNTAMGSSGSWRTLDWLVRTLHVQELTMNGRRLGAMFSDPGLIAQVMALRTYRSRGFHGPCLLIKSSGLASWNRLLFKRWQRVMPNGLSEQVVSGLHGSMFESTRVDELAQAIARFVAARQGVDAAEMKGA